MYLQCVVLGDPLHHVWHSCLENLLEREGVHHGEDPGKVLQNFFLLLHAHGLTVGHPDVRLLVVGNLYLLKRNMRCYTGVLSDSLLYNHCTNKKHIWYTVVKIFGCTW